jgi:hypothetical protein
MDECRRFLTHPYVREVPFVVPLCTEAPPISRKYLREYDIGGEVLDELQNLPYEERQADPIAKGAGKGASDGMKRERLIPLDQR